MNERPEPKFCVGELVEVAFVVHKANAHLVGVRFQITGVRWSNFSDGTAGWGYSDALVNPSLAPGARLWSEEQLRHPPKDEPTEWSDCIFQPTREGVPA